jgi:two-component system chemotaxis response regulator CheY
MSGTTFGKTSDYLSPFKILVVEPNPLMRRVTRNILMLLGARRIVDCMNLNQASAYLKDGDFDFILSEWYLQGSYGVDLIRWLRGVSNDVRFTPFIMMTSQTRLEHVLTARNSGITEFVAKPYSAHSLIMRIREIVERPRPFVKSSRYFGPDRRRRAGVMEENTDRRRDPALLMAGKDLTQEQIDHVVAGSSIGSH